MGLVLTLSSINLGKVLGTIFNDLLSRGVWSFSLISEGLVRVHRPVSTRCAGLNELPVSPKLRYVPLLSAVKTPVVDGS